MEAMSARDELHSYGECVYNPGDWVEWRCIQPQTHKIERGWVLAEGLSDEAEQLTRLNEQRYNIYAGPNARQSPGKTTDAGVLLARTVFVDFDHLENAEGCSYDELAGGRIEEAGLPLPTLRVFSGHGVHAYWRLTEAVKPDVWPQAQERLIATLATDPVIKNPERIMRLPGFDNRKDTPVPAFIIEADPQRVYTLVEILSHCRPSRGEAPTPARSPAAGRAANRSQPMGPLNRAMLYAGTWPFCGEGERNNEAFLHACQIANDFSLTEQEALDILRVWNTGNQPPLPDRELAATLKSALLHHKFTPGRKLDQPLAWDRQPRREAALPDGTVPGPRPANNHQPPAGPPPDPSGEPRNTEQGGRMGAEYVEDCIAGTLIDWPWEQLTELTELPAPGTVLALCGPPGSTKTFFMVQALRRWLAAGHAADMLIMEEDIEHILARCMAQETGQAGLTSRRWVKAHPEEARLAAGLCREQNDKLGRHLFDLPVSDITFPGMGTWLHSRIAAGTKILIVDPVTAAVQSESPWIEQGLFINGAKRLARQHRVSIILTTHPKMGKCDAISLDSLAGPAASIRFCQGVIWLESYDETKALPTMQRYDPHPEQRSCNRVMHLLKTRNAKGKGSKIAYTFDEQTLLFAEVGIVRRSKRRRKDPGEQEEGAW